ncbi:hypothetical protein [Flavobacterium psychrotolerans]|uniref:TonB C-terminal domain-containing protein n=1 Tax=Flavobacterium psychrotolerans TaxID=2169410 RepID=A0A2U1JM14_9FLAO|nr:hypothetical protein [Flavobacterium psychrotolerans]PWA05913.1 hypothetical protein DB895_05690 [Flavobacterium psychrotolerans]
MKTLLFFLVILSQYCIAQSPKPFETCRKTITYTVDDWVLRKKVGMDLTIPFSNPKFGGGVEELKKYFKANSLSNSNTFRILIGFIVNCKGQIGDFQIVSDEIGDLVILSEQVLEIVKKMPRKWKPATSKEGKPVDSYQVIQFTIIKGKFRDVEYK